MKSKLNLTTLATCVLICIISVSCADSNKPVVKVKNGIINVTNIPSGIKNIVVTFEVETGGATFERAVVNGTIEIPIEIGPEFAGKIYEPGKIQVYTFDVGGTEKKYENKESIKVNQSDQTQDLSMNSFKEVQ